MSGRLIGTLQLDDGVGVEEIGEFLEHIEDGDFIVETKWSKGKMEVYKRTDHKLTDVEVDDEDTE